jgi:hypothetical protein
MAQSDQLRLQVREYILLHPAAKNAEVMNELGVSMRTVSNVRAELRAQGMPPAWGDRKNKPKVNPEKAIAHATEGTFDVATTADLNKAVGFELEREAAAKAAADAQTDSELGPDGEIDIGKLKKVLWRVVRRNTDDRIVVAAASALARIQQEANQRPLGPQKPMTKADALGRLSMVFKPVGIALVFEATLKTFGVTEVIRVFMEWLNDARKEASVPSPVVQAPVEAAGASDNQTGVDAHSGT